MVVCITVSIKSRKEKEASAAAIIHTCWCHCRYHVCAILTADRRRSPRNRLITRELSVLRGLYVRLLLTHWLSVRLGLLLPVRCLAVRLLGLLLLVVRLL